MKTNVVLLLLFVLTSSYYQAQEFEEVSSHTGISFGSAIWVDKGPTVYNDLIIQGYDSIANHHGQILNHQYTGYNTGTSVMALVYGATRQIDANQDGLMDFIVTGMDSITSATNTFLFTQNSNGAYTETQLTASGISMGTLEVGDLNHDGIDDFIITGMDNGTATAKLYLGDGNGLFTEQTTPFFANFNGNIALFDVNNNGFTDVLITGFSSLGAVTTKLYINDGLANFTEQVNSGIDGFYFGDISVADYNNDGFIDVLISGMNSTFQKSTTIFENDGTGNFTEVLGLNLVNMNLGTVDFVDYNNDGDVDIFITGMDPSNATRSILYTNNNGVFTEEVQISSIFDGVNSSSTFWADYDHDGDLDLILTGVSSSGDKITKIYQNNFVNCIPVFTDGADDYEITNVKIRDIDNTSPANSLQFEDFTSINTIINRGESHEIKISGYSPDYPSDVMVYIDLNQNNSYTDPGESFYIGQMPASTSISSVTGSIYIEDTTNLGAVKMRIIKNANIANSGTNSITDPCQIDLNNGQTEEYILIMQEPPLCPLPSGLSYNVQSNLDVEFNWTHSSDTTNFTVYEWLIIPVGDSLTTNNVIQNGTVPNTQDFVVVSNLSSGEYDFILTTDCGTDTSNYIRETINIEHLSTTNNKLSNVNIYPNPVSNLLKVENENTIENVKLIDNQGKVVYDKNVQKKNFQIEMDNIVPGIYMLLLQNKETISQHKIIVR